MTTRLDGYGAIQSLTHIGRVEPFQFVEGHEKRELKGNGGERGIDATEHVFPGVGHLLYENKCKCPHATSPFDCFDCKIPVEDCKGGYG